jgi:hypothetical protein
VRRVLRFIFRSLIGVVALVGVLGALLGYYGYSPAPEVPRLSGTLTRGDYDGGRTEAAPESASRIGPSARRSVFQFSLSGQKVASRRMDRPGPRGATLR